MNRLHSISLIKCPNLFQDFTIVIKLDNKIRSVQFTTNFKNFSFFLPSRTLFKLQSFEYDYLFDWIVLKQNALDDLKQSMKDARMSKLKVLS